MKPGQGRGDFLVAARGQRVQPCQPLVRGADHHHVRGPGDRVAVAGIQQCVQHVFRRCRAVAKLGPGGVHAWATKVRKVLGEAHDAVTEAKAAGRSELDPDLTSARNHGVTVLDAIHTALANTPGYPPLYPPEV